MRKETLSKAIEEARRFIKLAEIAVDEIKEHQMQIERSNTCYHGYNHDTEPKPSRKFAATKRASLDLSAVLVELRKC